MQSPEFPQYQFVAPASWTRGRKTGQPSVVFVHTTEGSEGRTSAEAGAAYDARREDGTSTHFFCDQDTTVQCVRTTDEAHAARVHGNDVGVQVEVCGKAGQSSAQWADPASAGAVEQVAHLGVALRREYGKDRFPLVNLTPAQLRARQRGWAEHKDATLAWPQDHGTHTDPGPAFPWDRLFARIRELETPKMADVMSQDEFDRHLKGADVVPRYVGGAPVPPTDSNPTVTVPWQLGALAGAAQKIQAQLTALTVQLDAVGADAAACKGLLLKHTADGPDRPA